MLVALIATGDERTVTDLTGDGSSWTLDIRRLAGPPPDRARVTLRADGGGRRHRPRDAGHLVPRGRRHRLSRLTPTFPNRAAGARGPALRGRPDVDAGRIARDLRLREYWTNGTRLEGGSFPWSVSARETIRRRPWRRPRLTVLHPSRNPATGDMLYQHSVCIPGQGESGLYLYPEQGTTTPQRLPGLTDVDVYLATPSWLADGSGFLFLGSAARTNEPARIFAYDLGAGAATALLTARPVTYAASRWRRTGRIVYCLETGDRRDLHVVDATVSPRRTSLTERRRELPAVVLTRQRAGARRAR